MSVEGTSWDEMPEFAGFMNTLCDGNEELKTFLQTILDSGLRERPLYHRAAPEHVSLVLWSGSPCGKTVFSRLMQIMDCALPVRTHNDLPTWGTRTDAHLPGRVSLHRAATVYMAQTTGFIAESNRRPPGEMLDALLVERKQIEVWLAEGRQIYERNGLHVPACVQVLRRPEEGAA